MAGVCLDSLIFYNPAVAAGPKPASRGLLGRKGDPSAVIPGASFHPPRPPPQDAHDAQRGGAGKSQDDAILIPSDGESDDDLDDGRSDPSFPPLEELLAAARKKAESGSVVGTDKSVNAAPGASGDSDARKPSVSGGADSDYESVSTQQQPAPGLDSSPAPSSASAMAVYAERDQSVSASRREADCAGISCRQGLGCPRHPKQSAIYRQFRNAKSPKAKADNPLYHPETPPGGSSDIGETEQLNGHSLPREDECPAETGDAKDCLPSARSGSREGSLCSDRGSEGDEPEPADAELPLQPPGSQDRIDFWRDVGGHREADYRPTRPPVPDTEPRLRLHRPCSAASSLGVETQQRPDNSGLSQHHDHRGDSVQTSDPEYRHPLVSDDVGEQDEESSVVPPQAQESRAGMPSLSGDESGNERELANIEPSMQPSAGQERVNLQHNIGHRRRRRRCDTDDEEDYSPIVGSDAKQGKDEDAVQPTRGKRRRVNTSAPTTRRTAPKRRARLRCARISKPQSAGASALEEEALEAAFASFEEWPLEAVLKRVWVDGVATFQVEFTWNPCTNHGQNGRAPESPRRKSPAGRTPSTGRALSSRVASTAEEVRGDEYFQVEDILDSRQREGEWEYLVKWEGYGHKHNTWEPAAHFEQCLEILEQFHQSKGLPTIS